LSITLLSLWTCIIAHDVGTSGTPPNFIPDRPTEPTWKAPKQYLDFQRHDIEHRDHGCVEIEHDDVNHHKPYYCVSIWLKNKYSEQQLAPSSVFLDFQHPNEHKEYAYKPTVTWVENVNPWRIRGCVAAPGGKDNTLAHGKLRWFAIYDASKNNNQQHGSIDGSVFTSNHLCQTINFPITFVDVPHLKFQVKHKYGLMSAHNALVAWGKAVSANQATVCLEEFYGWSGYHHDFEIHWYGIVNPELEDNYSEKLKVVWQPKEDFPMDHNQLNHFYCKNITLGKWYHPCPSVMVQAFEPNTAVCESALVAWVAYLKNDQATVCYADKRGISDKRKVAIEAHIIIYGKQDTCQAVQPTCGAYQECVYDSVTGAAKCGCHTHCHDDEEKACGTNMMTYKNRCELEKAACEAGGKFEYAHHGPCEEYTFGHGSAQLGPITDKDCDGLYCQTISTGNRIWYQHAHINVQISVNWANKIDGDDQSTHDASASWIENITPNQFTACVMEAGRFTKSTPPSISWFAYQGKVDKVMTQKIEVGDWQSGTHCVPLHERKETSRPIPHQPPSCPKLNLGDYEKMSQDEERWHYDSSVMSKIHGQTQHEWFKRMMKGYSIKKVKLSSGMKLGGAAIMLTVEQSQKDSVIKSHDAVNVWMEHDAASEETYVCLREMQNWDGKHEGIHVHWTLFMDEDQKQEDIHREVQQAPDHYHATPETTKAPVVPMLKAVHKNHLGFINKLKFKPALAAPEESNYAFCQLKEYLPQNFTQLYSATVLVSIDHYIPEHAAFESMKKYEMHQMEINRGVPFGDMKFNDEMEQTSWMMPHMWRANLTGWRPHMRINKNADYSAWLEGMNSTHMKVCQKSVFNGYNYDGVDVNVVVLPERCPVGYIAFRDQCYSHNPLCSAQADQKSQCGGKLPVPKDARENVFISYRAAQQAVIIGKERVNGIFASTPYSRWGANEPSSDSSKNCVSQSGVVGDYEESAVSCTLCHRAVCSQAQKQLSCDFPMMYCMNGGKCSYASSGPQCACLPPYNGARCENKP
uniref:EGF-like domain-containing protein n=2 Tax=Clytia hemisphaerica TaxID=252671 RepID=A0A7M5XJW8_9CNID